MTINEKAFQAFMLAVHEHGTSGLGYRKALEAYKAAETPVSLEKCAEASWDATPTHCEVTWREAHVFDSEEWKRSILLHERVTKAVLDAAGCKYE